MRLLKKLKLAIGYSLFGGPKIVAALIVAISIMFGGFFIGHGIYKASVSRTVTVKGLSEMNVVADTAVWNINLTNSGNNLVKLQDKVDKDIAAAKAFLTKSGFTEAEIQNGRLKLRDNYSGYMDKSNIADRYVIEVNVIVRTNNVDLVENTSRNLGELVKAGIPVSEDYSGPIYIFNGLNDIKIKMIEESTKNATAAGKQFAKDARAKLGKIKTADQGIFSIQARDPIDAWSSNETQAINKKVRVVSTITFYLK